MLFEGHVALDMRVVCPQNVKKDASETSQDGLYWKSWAANHKGEELKEGVWLEPVRAMLRGKTNEVWTDMHRNVTRKPVVEGCWVQRRLYDIGWSDEKKCRGCKKEEERTEKHRRCHCP